MRSDICMKKKVLCIGKEFFQSNSSCLVLLSQFFEPPTDVIVHE